MSDISLCFTDTGEGKPLFLLHGNGEDRSIFSRQLEYFSESRRVIAPDTRGHGRSPRGDAPFTVPQFADDLSALFDELKIERADVLGFSDGGNIAMYFALKYPERVDRLILNGANLRPSGVYAKYQIPIVFEYLAACTASVFDKKAVKKREMLSLMVHWPRLTEKEISAIRAKTLVLAGTDDMIKERHTRAIAAAIPSSRLVFIKGSHFLVGDSPEEYCRTVEAFLLEDK